eukprot:TRINITY_DN5710_c0_g1_i2.p1 TRINITY_DN5710_c0_g1~~TRINITY_DN5710_c0_g1_i2.p1  ORF type:complete len:438 (+),score=108.35 TRINITY_DN5710_c0_g1_i2:59-1372(+)
MHLLRLPLLKKGISGNVSLRSMSINTSIDIVNPANGSTIATVSADTEQHVREKILDAKNAVRDWKETPLQERKEIMRKFASNLQKSREEIAQVLTHEMGKPITQSRNEANATVGRVNWFIDNVEKAISEQLISRGNGMVEKITYEPLGVVANISAWNYPLFVGSNVLVPALLTGNAVLYKPSEITTLTGLFMVKLLHQAGVPADVLAPVVGGGAVGSYLLKEYPFHDNKRAQSNTWVDGVFFTGSVATGKKIATAAGSLPIKVQLELGGKDPSYVCEDVDVGKAVDSLADGAFYNNGQSCCSVERIYVHKKIAKEFIEKFVATVKTFKMGDPLDVETYLGPLARPQQAEFLSFQVQDAVSKGAKLLHGGAPTKVPGLSGVFFEPTVLTDVNHTMSVMAEESFGPIIGIQAVENDDEAIRLMNDNNYGLTSGIYTKDE